MEQAIEWNSTVVCLFHLQRKSIRQWKIMESYRVPPKLVKMVKVMRDGMSVQWSIVLVKLIGLM